MLKCWNLLNRVGYRVSGLPRPRLYSQSKSHLVSKSGLFTMAINVGGMRKEYPGVNASFDVCDLSCREPIGQFRAWFDAARSCPEVEEPNAVCLATADATGIPSAR